MNKKNSGFNKASVVIGLICALVISALFLNMSIFTPITEEQVMKEQRKNTLVTGDPVAGQSGFFYFTVWTHQADPGSAYANNLTYTNGYEYATSGDVVATGETPFNTAFDIVLKVGVNVSDGWNTTESRWDEAYQWLTLTCADLSIGADTNMTEIQIANTSTYAWYQYYLNNGGAGYTINEGEHFNVTSCKFWVKRLVP